MILRNRNYELKDKKQTKKPEEKIPEKKKACYDVTVEILTPITVKYRVWAYSPEEAAEDVQKGRVHPSHISKPLIRENTIRSLIVFVSGTINRVFSLKKFNNLRF